MLSTVARLVVLFLWFSVSSAVITESVDDLVSDISRYFTPRDFISNDNGSLRLSVRGGRYMFMEGTINSSTPDAMARLFERNPGVEVIVMTNVPGSADDEANLYISLVIHELGLWTYVPSQGEIASGGTDMFLAGERRILHPDSRVGVHSFSFDDDDGNPVSGADLPLDDEIHQFYLDYYRDIGIDEDFYWFTLRAASADDIHYLTATEKKRYHLYTDLHR